MIYVFIAHGFEEIEAITIVDVLRRADLEVKTVGIGNKTITGAHGITLHCDMLDREASKKDLKAVVLPGGMPGTTNLNNSKLVHSVINYCNTNKILIAAICAAPMIIGEMGLLEGKNATVFPGMENHLKGAILSNSTVAQDDYVITGNGPSAALEFSLKIVEHLAGAELSQKIGDSMQCHITH